MHTSLFDWSSNNLPLNISLFPEEMLPCWKSSFSEPTTVPSCNSLISNPEGSLLIHCRQLIWIEPILLYVFYFSFDISIANTSCRIVRYSTNIVFLSNVCSFNTLPIAFLPSTLAVSDVNVKLLLST